MLIKRTRSVRRDLCFIPLPLYLAATLSSSLFQKVKGSKASQLLERGASENRVTFVCTDLAFQALTCLLLYKTYSVFNYKSEKY